MIDARRLEELSLNSSAPPGQLLYDGWLLRLAPGKAKRARSVNAVYASRLPLAAKIAHCERVYGQAGLPALFRITPFSEPAGLEEQLALRDYGRFDETLVATRPIDSRGLPRGAAQPLELPEWVAAVAQLRASSDAHRAAHLARLQAIPLPVRGVAVRAAGRIVATGLAVVEDEWAGFFDVITHPEERGKGHAREVMASLLRLAADLGAGVAYLQVQADNEPALRLYRELGFEERSRSWSRARPGERQ